MKRSAYIFISLIMIIFVSVPLSARITSSYLYFSAGAIQLAREIEIPGVNDLWRVRTETQTGLLLSCGGGYSMGGNFRLEYDIAYRKISFSDVEINDLKVIGVSIQGGEGDVISLSFMLNGWYDLIHAGRWAIYLGGGLGAGLISLKNVYIETAPVVPNPVVTKTLYVDDNDWRFAMQGGAGITYALSADFTLDLGYRYYATADPKFITEMGNEFFADVQSHTVLISLKFLY